MVLQLTKAEEQVMKILWELEQGTVQQVLEKFELPKPARTTVATVLNILENKGFVAHETEGKVNIYLPLVKKENYSKSQLFGIMKNYFDNSFASMASFFARENNLSMEELDQLLEETREALKACR
ncbi:MAG: BlaI/MecI/CopY family transcriptional regulator [Dysgonamonadaceae bacterium]|jgi:predicted transcriptional regulator|nr:BlaI/MecI/CopY family transcriptional regulator [Dysgonamonadaceae bacterium]